MSTTFVYNSGEDEAVEEELELVFGVFIDGTLNNKYNTDLRTKHGRTQEDGSVNEKLSNDQIEAADKEEYAKIKNKERIAELIANKYRTAEEQLELDAVSEKERYLVASHRTDSTEEFINDELGTNNSFSNDYTNVARMWKYCESEVYAVYVEGMGTDKESRDSQDGFAFGAGLTGIRARVRDGCKQIAERIAKEKKKQPDKILTKITLDVFGFSRGAAATRNFVHEVHQKSGYEKCKEFDIPDGYKPKVISYSAHDNDRMPVKKTRKAKVDVDEIEIDASYLIDDKLPEMGHLGYSLLLNTSITFEELKDIKIVVRFVGIYDTVSSYYESGGIGEYDVNGNVQDGGMGKAISEGLMEKIGLSHFNSNVEPLKLNKIEHCQKIVHFTAKDEHRTNFSLTRIPNANMVNGQGNKVRVERNFPGVHCDIGGAYMSEVEVVDEIGTNLKDGFYKTKFYDFITGVSLLFRKTGLKALEQDLIDQYWYKDNQLEINNQKVIGSSTVKVVYKKLTGTRDLKKEYSYIPLHFMEEYARDTGMEAYFSDDLKLWFPLDNFLLNVKRHMSPYAKGDTDEEWEFKTDKKLQERQEKRDKEEKLQNEMDRKIESAEANNFSEIREPVYDNKNPKDYQRRIDLDMIQLTKENEIQGKTEDEIIYSMTLDEIVLTSYNQHQMLRRLRNEYLHWSSNRDWFGMQPNTNRIRKEF